MRVLILVLVVAICFCSQDASLNFTHLIQLNNYSYELSSEEKTWDAAKASCERNGGSLAVLNSPSLLSSVRNYAFAQSSERYWVGLNRTGDQYMWVNGDQLDSSFLPNITSNPAQRCYAIGDGSSDMFTHRKCNSPGHEFKFICGFPINNSADNKLHTSSMEPSPHSTSSSLVRYEETSSVQPSPHSTSSSLVRYEETSSVQPSPHSTSSSLVRYEETSSVQPSQSSWFSSSYMRTTSDINPTKTRPVQPSTSVTSPSTSPQEKPNMINEFHKFMKDLNTSNPDSMSLLLTEYEGVMEWIDEQDHDDMKDYNPLTDAQDIEHIALDFTKKHLGSSKKNISITRKDIVFHAMVVDADHDSDVTFPEANKDPDVNTISLPKSLFKGREIFVVNVVYKNNKTFKKLTPTKMEGQPDDNKAWSINTEIFSMTIIPKRKQLPENVNITLRHLQKKIKDAKLYCSFWNFSIRTNYSGSWSRQGCELISSTDAHTVCSCNHLTNFAVLMKLNDHEVSSAHQKALLVITYVGLALSVLGEAITVLLYCVFLNLRHEKIQIRVNLLCSLAAAQIVFLAGINMTENKDVCTMVASLIHLLYLVAFCWMLMEGVYLYRMVVQVFDAHITMRYSYIFAFGFPLGVLAVSLITAATQDEGIYSYVSPDYCWIRWDNGFIWSFIAPVLMLIAVNCFFLFSVLKEMALMKSVKTINSLELSSIRASARACVVLLPLLGITWLFGLLSIDATHVAWEYLFTIFNAMQGFLIFIFHCLRNTELRAAIELRYFQWESSHTNHGHRSSTPKFLTFDESEKSRSNSLPMTTKVNQVTPKKDGTTA